jgi:hypothetical protein
LEHRVSCSSMLYMHASSLCSCCASISVGLCEVCCPSAVVL